MLPSVVFKLSDGLTFRIVGVVVTLIIHCVCIVSFKKLGYGEIEYCFFHEILFIHTIRTAFPGVIRTIIVLRIF